MKTLIIYISIHHGNTEKIAKEIAGVLDAKLLAPREVNVNDFSECDLVGFGSGIYFGKHHENLLRFVDRLPMQENRKAFIFSTSGMKNGIAQRPHGSSDFNKLLKEKLLGKGFDIIGNFSCRGFDTYGPFKFIGGISKGRPNKEDLEKARKFARSLKDENLLE
jgi:flavodoxin